MSTRPVHEMEAKWQARWESEGTYRAADPADATAEKFYGLIEFPYPSGEGLHVGHPRSYTAIDLVTRKRRMEGKNVLYPIGWDAFGLPTENFAIKHKIAPAEATRKNVANFTRQIKSLGFGFDWSREINTTDPAYYKWTQWQFLQFVKAGLAYKAASTINWCPRCKIGLANEEAQGGVCERCGNPVEKREKAQWMIKITKYAERLLTDLDSVDYLDKIKSQQVNWIGKSEGAEVQFVIEGRPEKMTVFTTRPDTLFGVTYVVLAPEHELVDLWMKEGVIKNKDAVQIYRDQVKNLTDIDRTSETKEKTGVVLEGLFAVNPVNNERIPVWTADYVLASYGTGAVMAVPAHDERDYAFAQTLGLLKKCVVMPNQAFSISPSSYLKTREEATEFLKQINRGEICWAGSGVLVNSEFLDGLSISEAKAKMVAWLEEKGVGKHMTTYRLRDWVFSRQRYWGEPIPLVHCKGCAQKKQKVLLIHGFEASSQTNWLPWMKTELEQRGFEVFAPTMSTSAHPDLEAWMNELMPIMKQLGEDDMIVAHSLGGKAVLHLVERAQQKIGTVIIAASAIGQIEQRDWERFREEWKGSDVDALKKFWEVPHDWSKIMPLIERKHLVYSDDDPELRPHMNANIPAGWYRQVWHGYEHLDGKRIPELLELVLSNKVTGWIPLPETQLPLTLPTVEAYEPTDTGESPLAKIRDWVETTCPRCSGPAERETDTMPNWAGSSWYFLRYCDPKNDKEFASAEALKYWMPVDLYNGGMEHTTLHLLYSRFWHKFLWDLGYIPTECGSEPYRMRRSHNMILGEGGVKMSKSKGNVINPDDVVSEYGADAFRLYEMFLGPYDQPATWDTNGIEGVRRFLDKTWNVFEMPALSVATPDLETLYHQTVKKVGEGIDGLQFNTCISQLMILVNALQEAGGVPTTFKKGVIQLLAPFAPHIASELWEQGGFEGSVHNSGWPVYDETKLVSLTFELVVQINGKIRERFTVNSDISEEEAKSLVLRSATVQKWLEGKEPKKVVYIPGRLVSIVV